MNPIADDNACGTYTFPTITGSNLSDDPGYHTAPNGGGTFYSQNQTISLLPGTYTFYAYEGTLGCDDEQSFTVTFQAAPDIDPIADLNGGCGGVVLPAITGSDLTGNELYYDNPGGMGNPYSAGDLITTSGFYYAYDGDAACSDEEVFLISVGGNINLSLVQTAFILCNGENTAALDLSILDGQAPYLIDWNDNSLDGTEDPSGLSAGTYEVTVVDDNSCSGVISITVNEPAEIILDCAVTSNVSVFGGNDGAAQLDISGGTPPFEMTWTGPVSGSQSSVGVGVFSLPNLSAGEYEVNIIDANGCRASCLFDVTEPFCNLSLELEAKGPTCTGTNDIQLELTINNPTGAVSIDWNVDVFDGIEDPDVLTPGFYQVTVTDQICSQVISVTALDAAPLDLDCVVTMPASSMSSNDGEAKIEILNGTAPYSISWTGPTPGTQMVGANSAIISGLLPGLYMVTVTDDNGCEATCQFTVTSFNCDLAIDLLGFDVTCNRIDDGAIDLTITGGTPPFTIDWDNDIFDGIEDLTGLTAGIYSVTVKDLAGCTVSGSIEIFQPIGVLLSCSVVSDVSAFGANDGAAQISFSGGVGPYTITWTGPVSGSQNAAVAGMIDLMNLTAGTYVVTLFDTQGCEITCGFTINNPGCSLSLQVESYDLDCGDMNEGEINLTVTGASGAITYDWDLDVLDGMEDVSNLAPGVYSVTVSDEAGCSTTAEITIDAPAPLVLICAALDTVSALNADDGMAELIYGNGTPPYLVEWTGPVSGSQISNFFNILFLENLPVGVYEVSITDENGCFETCTFEITGPSCDIAADQVLQNPSCFGANDGSIDLTITGAVLPLTFDWSNNLLDGQEDPTGLVAGLYSVTITDAIDCEVILDINLFEPAVLMLDCAELTPVSTVGGNDGVAEITFSGGTEPYTIMWSGPSSGTQMAAVPGFINITDLVAGSYSVTLTDANNCTINCGFTISDPVCNLMLDITSTNESCPGAMDGSIDLEIIGGKAPFMITWEDGPMDEDRNGISAGFYSVTVVDDLGCVATASVNINVDNPAPQVAISGGGSVCLNDCFVFDIQFLGTPPFMLQYEVDAGAGPQGFILTTSNTIGLINICPSDFGASSGDDITISFLEIIDSDCTTPLNQTETLNVGDISTFDLTETLCTGDFIVVNGTTYDENNPAGTETIVGGSASGCDSIVNVMLTYLSIDTNFITDQLCFGEILIVNGTIYEAASPSGIEVLPGAGANGCDSV
ncbi:MAG TPA: SprB repeat-containing protein, partial [Saprospiraceae bacterium]|nr:SprB repeat-containing protein [Saprospiraceae bacterium]HMQ83617.1 SprB repeat-containing protein [Saprospiraceae bacterium]